jgi:hypothetical protein
MTAAASLIPGAAHFEVPAPQAANSVQELQMEKRHWSRLASAHDFPKFVNGGC